MGYLQIKNWSEFQHYKDRNPPWIKLHRTLLDDYEFACLQDASKLHLMLIWLFGSQSEGRVPDDPDFLQRKLGLKSKPDLKSLVEHGFLIPVQDASNTLAPDASKLRLETETYKTTDKSAALPDWIPVESWNAWIKQRKNKPTVEAKRLAIVELEKLRADGQDPKAVLDQSTFRGWTGLFPVKGDGAVQKVNAI